MVLGQELLVFGYLGVFLIGFLFGIIPFFGPSNLVIAFLLTMYWPWGVPMELVPLNELIVNMLLISLMISFGVSLAKAIHYYIVRKSRHFLSEQRKKNLDIARVRIGRWASVAVFLSASTPIPDEPVVFTVALMRYSMAKFLLAFFAGKIVVTVGGGVAGLIIGPPILAFAGGELPIVVTITLTIILTGIIVAWYLEKVASKKKGEESTRSEQKSRERPNPQDKNAES